MIDIEKISLVYDKKARLEVTKEFEFESCHKLLDYEGACSRMHGHSYKLQVTMSGLCDNRGIVIDFKDIKKMVKEEILSKLDHENLNEILPFNTTAENMVKWIFDVLEAQVKMRMEKNVRVEKIRLWETSTSYATYKRG